MKKLCLTLMLMVAMTGNAWGEEVKLFKDYYYGMSKADVQKMSKAIPCQDAELKGQLCAKGTVPFAKQQWEQAYIFTDDKLESIFLGRDLEEQTLERTVGAISGNDFAIALVSSPKGQLDILAVTIAKGVNAIGSEVSKFEAMSLETGEINYTFLEQEILQAVLKKHESENIHALLLDSPVNMRGVEISIQDNYIVVRFTAPVKAINEVKKNMQESKEVF